MSSPNILPLLFNTNTMTPHRPRWQQTADISQNIPSHPLQINKSKVVSKLNKGYLSPKTPTKMPTVLCGKFCSMYRKSPIDSSHTRSKESKTKSVSHSMTPKGCRYIPNRSLLDLELASYSISSSEEEFDRNDKNNKDISTVPGPNITESCRILSFQAAKPLKSDESAVIKSDVLYSISRANGPKSQRAKANRHIHTQPERVLDAPGVKDDFYLNCLDWNLDNIIALALDEDTYLWNSTTAQVSKLTTISRGSDYISSVKWSSMTKFLALGTSGGAIELWDVNKNTRLRVLDGHQSRVGALAWNGHTLCTGSKTGTLCHHDVRIADHLFIRNSVHDQEVCGLSWSDDGQYLASGGNDNVLCIYNNMSLVSPIHSLSEHTAAVKAISWCPWQSSLLASGGGTSDRCIRFWNASTGKCISTTQTDSQISSLIWNSEYKELVSGHGFAHNLISIWKYPNMKKITDLNGHTDRVLNLTKSPDESMIASLAADETLRLWNIFPHQASYSHVLTSTKSTKLSPSTTAITTSSNRLVRSIR